MDASKEDVSVQPDKRITGRIEKASVRMYMSRDHLASAAFFARQAIVMQEKSRGLEDWFGPYTYSVGAVLLSSSAMEAALNELLIQANEKDSSLQSLDEVIRRSLAALSHVLLGRSGSWEAKIKAIIRLTEEHATPATQFTSLQLWQDALLLTQLRNVLAHPVMRMTTIYSENPDEIDVHRVEQQLRQRVPRIIPESGPHGIYGFQFPYTYLGKDCAAWAVNTARDTISEIYRRFGLRPHIDLQDERAFLIGSEG